jgi:serine/threonine protein phosphatase PrpC/tRNA A-37 threonylcarbamoyl transferase component Bud32
MIDAGTLIADRYRILEQLPALPGMRRYSAQNSNGHSVVLLEGDSYSTLRLSRAADALQRVNHPHPGLPPVLETFEAADATYLVLDTPPGRPLADGWQDPSVSDRQRLNWLLQLCRSLEALQSVGAALSALPPDVVSVVGGQAVLTDPSGIQLLALGANHLNRMAYYTPLEMFQEPPQVSDQANVYLLGALLASLLLGRQLRDEDLREDGPRPIREVLPTVSPEVEDILLTAMQPYSEYRPHSISLLADLLSGLQPLLDPRLISGAATNIGMARLANQDRYLLKQLGKRTPEGEVSVTLLAVADGIGGEEGGATASRLALEYLDTFLVSRLNTLLAQESAGEKEQGVFTLLQRGAKRADRAIREAARIQPEMPYMGTTLAVALIVGSHAYIGNAGDSRVYLVTRDSLQQLSEDHTATAELVRQGRLVPGEVMNHPAHRQLTRALGYGPVELSFTGVEIQEGECLLLCSDGVTAVVPDEEIADLFATHQGPEAICRQLVHLANLRGGPDNITAVALRRVPRRLFGWHGFIGEQDIQCYQCGTSNPGAARFCQACGAKLLFVVPTGPAQSWVDCPFCNAVSPQGTQFCNTCGQLLPLLPGVIFASRYRVVRMLGQGGMGRGYLVDDLEANERRVLKELISDINSSPAQMETYLRYFRNEAEVQSLLGAVRAVPTVLEPVQEYDDRYFFVMEYIAGDDLWTVMKKRGRPFSPDRVRRWAMQLCDLLTRLHTHQPGISIIHRDITPDNIKLRSNDDNEASDIALLDFGIAHRAPHAEHFTQGLGKEGYVAPEQLAGRPESRSDLYSLAATMHFLLTNRDPSANPPPFPPASELNPQVPQWLTEIIAINLREDPAQRYPSAAVFKADLEKEEVSLY